MIALKRTLFVSAVLLVCAWVIVPIYLIALGGIGGQQVVYAWPKPFLPLVWSVQNFTAFLAIDGIWQALLRAAWRSPFSAWCSPSRWAHLAGYALARYAFRGANAYRLTILLTRAFPVGILALPLAVSYVRLGIYDTAIGVALIHTALALPFAVLVTSSLFLGIPRELEEAALGVRLFRLRCVPPGRAGPLALPGVAAAAVFAFVLSWNEVFAASVLTVRHKTLTAFLLSVLSRVKPLPISVRWAASCLHHSFRPVHFLRPPLPLRDVWGITSR